MNAWRKCHIYTQRNTIQPLKIRKPCEVQTHSEPWADSAKWKHRRTNIHLRDACRQDPPGWQLCRNSAHRAKDRILVVRCWGGADTESPKGVSIKMSNFCECAVHHGVWRSQREELTCSVLIAVKFKNNFLTQPTTKPSTRVAWFWVATWLPGKISPLGNTLALPVFAESVQGQTFHLSQGVLSP